MWGYYKFGGMDEQALLDQACEVLGKFPCRLDPKEWKGKTYSRLMALAKQRTRYWLESSRTRRFFLIHTWGVTCLHQLPKYSFVLSVSTAPTFFVENVIPRPSKSWWQSIKSCRIWMFLTQVIGFLHNLIPCYDLFDFWPNAKSSSPSGSVASLNLMYYVTPEVMFRQLIAAAFILIALKSVWSLFHSDCFRILYWHHAWRVLMSSLQMFQEQGWCCSLSVLSNNNSMAQICSDMLR